MIKRIPVPVMYVILSVFLLTFTIKGRTVDNRLYYQTELDSALGGPFESSNSRSRFALVEAIVNQHSVYLNQELKNFADPDIVLRDNKYLSVFLPGISFLAIPLYLIGTYFGIPQITAYLLNFFMAIIDMVLIYYGARRIGAQKYSSLLAGFIFIFATNALTYSETLTQHLTTLALMVLALLNIMDDRTVLNDIKLGIIVGASLLIDIPNIIMLIPIVAYAAYQHIQVISGVRQIKLSVNYALPGLVIGIVPLIAVFIIYNSMTTHSPFTVAQNVASGSYSSPGQSFTAQSLPVKSIFDSKLPIDSRALIQGLYVLLISNERGIFYYNSVIVFGIIGLILIKRNKTINKTLFQVVLLYLTFTTLTYAMFHDPWGGWSFGPRYLIPVTGVLSIFVAPAIDRFGRKPIFILLFFSLLIYSTLVNVSGGLTTSLVPPKQEAELLTTQIPYTYSYNIKLLSQNFTGSLLYNTVLYKLISVNIFYYLYSAIIVASAFSIYSHALKEGKQIL